MSALTAPEHGLHCICGAVTEPGQPCGETWIGMVGERALVELRCLGCGDGGGA